MATDWQRCVEQIRSCLRAAWVAEDCESALQLCETLQDGQVLCEMLTELSDGKICGESAYFSANSQKLAQRNVAFFLKKLRSHFGIPEAELFKPEDLLETKSPGAVVATLNALFAKCSPAAPDASAKFSELQHLVREICENEKAYLKKLKAMLEIREQLLSLLSLWDRDLVLSMFEFLNDLFLLHQPRSEELESLAKKGDGVFCFEVGNFFSRLKPSMQLYDQAISNTSASKLKIESACEERHLEEQLTKLTEHFCGSDYDFHTIYDAPYNQLIRYQNLLERLLKLTEKRMPQASGALQQALVVIKDSLHSINDHFRYADTEKQLRDIANLPVHLKAVQETGLHEADENFNVRLEGSSKRYKDYGKCFCLLTQKKLIVATLAAKEELQFCFCRPLSDSMQITVDTAVGLKLFFPDGDVLHFANSKGDSPKKMEKWSTHFEKMRSFNFPPGWNSDGHNFCLASFPSGTKCSLCSKELDGFMYQGYECKSHCTQRLHRACMEMRHRVERRQSMPLRPTPQPAMNLFHKDVDRTKAWTLLLTERVGAFLFRPKTDDKETIVLTLKVENDCKSIQVSERIVDNRKEYSLQGSNMWHVSLEELVEFYQTNSMEYHFPKLPFKLANGVPPKGASKTLTRQNTRA